MQKLGIFIFGGPGSGKDYVLKNIFSRFDLIEVQADQILNGAATMLLEDDRNIVINCSSDCEDKMQLIKSIMEGYTFDHVFVYVNNKVSRQRNQSRVHSLREDVRIRKLLKVEKFASNIPDVFTFNNSINLLESSDFEKLVFAGQIEKLLERLVSYGLQVKENPTPKSYTQFNEDLRTWFKQKWVRMDTKGNIAGECARGEGEGKPKCLPMAKAKAMSKKDRKRAVLRKRRQDPVADREGKGNAPVFVATEEVLLEKNVPTNPELWSRAKALARQKFDVYPSAYANGWASKWYKSKGGGWKSVSEVYEWGTDETVKAFKAMTPGESNNVKVIQASMGMVQKDSEEESDESGECECGGACGCGGSCSGSEGDSTGAANRAGTARKTLKTFRQQQEEASQVDLNPTLKTKPTKKSKGVVPAATYDPTKDGMYSYGGLNPATNY